MKVRDLITELLKYNLEAEVQVVNNSQKYDISISFGYSEGVVKSNAEEILFYAEEYCKKDKS
jgi:hypothetical protein